MKRVGSAYFVAWCGLLLAACPAHTPRGLVGCPREVPAGPAIPGQAPRHLLADYWLARYPDADRLLLDGEAIARHNARLRAAGNRESVVARVDLLRDSMVLPRTRQLEGLSTLRAEAAAGHRVMGDGKPPSDALLARMRDVIESLRPVEELRGVVRSTPLRCYPTLTPVLETLDDWAFDLGQCSQLHFGEVVRVLGRSKSAAAGALWYVRGAYAAGWVEADALSPPLAAPTVKTLLEPSRFVVVTHDRVGLWTRPDGGSLLGVAHMGARFPLLEDTQRRAGGTLAVRAVGPQGLVRAYIRRPSRVHVGYLPLTRRHLLRTAFELVHTPYGWGGMGAQRDCSRLVMDIFTPFGLLLPRNSSQQAEAGVRHVDVSELPDADKRRAIEEAGRHALVLLYLKGHIMLYVGREGSELYALHLFSGYLVPCARGGETMHRVNRTTVTNLELGRGSSRRAFIQRIERLVVIGPAASPTPSTLPTSAP